MINRFIFLISISISLCVAGVFTPAPAHPPQWEEILREAEQKTDDEFASKISNLTLTFRRDTEPWRKTDISVNQIDRIFSTGAGMVFDRVIKPFIRTKFEEDISDEYLIVQRKLLKTNLYQVEAIDGRDVYSIHIDFVVKITDKESEFSHTTLRGQECLFLIKAGKIVDITSFSEYVTETDEKEIKKYLDSVSNTE